MTIADLVRQRARSAGARIAYTLLVDGADDARSITWAQLDERAAGMAAALHRHGVGGKPVLLALPSSLAFVESLLGCWYAGAVAVPVSLPRHPRTQQRLERIASHCGARVAIATPDIQARLAPTMPQVQWIDPAVAPGETIDAPLARASHHAVLQYTSGSTGEPRGVIVGHDNLLDNSAQISRICGHDEETVIGGWLPLFHDMGLVGLIIQAAFTGSRCVFMSPERFLMRPRSWLAMIDRYRIRSSPAPNFAYDLCVEKVTDSAGLDLSAWRNALNGSEPVRAATLDRFARAFAPCGFDRRAFLPCYGLAEATLMVTAPDPDRRGVRRRADGSPLPNDSPDGHVGCGNPPGNTRIAIVDPGTRVRVRDTEVGEVWVDGPSVARGYFDDVQACAATFGAMLSGEEGSWLRTGDLGFINEGSLFITGRLRELIVVLGRNIFPTDIERTAELVDAAVGSAAAFPVDVQDSERLVVAVELRREVARSGGTVDAADLQRRIAVAISCEHEIAPHEVVLLSWGRLPRTTSGKISRIGVRDAYIADTLHSHRLPLTVDA
ncbi:MAG: fatty acyl-AMP ligase [Pseudomonadota bacterium]